jgi:hypothetical protein
MSYLKASLGKTVDVEHSTEYDYDHSPIGSEIEPKRLRLYH